MQHSQKATIIGLGAVILWSLLALLTAFNNHIPPFQLLGSSFFVATLLGVIFMLVTKQSFSLFLNIKWQAWLLGIFGLSVYHLFYFLAIRYAPPMEANLINSLWPLLIVLGSTLILKRTGEGGGLRWWHLTGALLGLIGLFSLSLNKDVSNFESSHLIGYGFAIGCALIWSSYSLLSRLYADTPSAAVTGFCFVTCILSFIIHFMFEQTVMPNSTISWITYIAIGLGPVGGAFYFWDYGMKHGNMRALGAAAYLSPIFATFFLAWAGIGELNLTILIACALVIVGSLLAAIDNFIKMD